MAAVYHGSSQTTQVDVDISQEQDSQDDETDHETSLLTQYDPYHQTTYTLQTPFPLKHLTGEAKQSDRRFLLYGSASPSWKVNYEDFAPEVRGFEDGNLTCQNTFQDLVDRANQWLRQNPQLQVRTCETITRTASCTVQVGETESVDLDRCVGHPLEGDTYYHVGLRLWVQPKSPDHQDRQICFRDYKATDKEKLSYLVRRINNTLLEDPLPGNIITTETVLVPNFPSWDTARLFWREPQCQQAKYNLYVRLFYLEGLQTQESIGIKNIVPEVVNGSCETFSCLMRKASCWISGEPSLRITNVKSVYVCKENESIQWSADRCTHYHQAFGSQQYIQLLRVFYIQRHQQRNSEKRHVINCMTFTPVQTTLGPNIHASFETMKQTMIRISAWIQLAGAQVYSTESFITPLVPNFPNHQLPEKTFWSPNMAPFESISRRFLMHIRIYIDGEFHEPDSRLLPPLPYSLTLALQASLQQREMTRLHKQEKRRRRRRRILILVAFAVIVIAGGIILLEQKFDLFHFRS